MPSYKSFLVITLAASTVAPVLAAAAVTKPLYGILYLE